MNAEDCKKVELIAEVKVRRYFDHFLNEILPAIISAHDKDVNAHTRQIKVAVKAESSRVQLWLIGAISTVAFGGGIGVTKLVAVLMGN